jgi:leucyl aminopeptidase (aminopeptidase T)
VADLGPAIDTILTRCLAVQRGENVLVVSDPGKRQIADALRAGARALGAESVLAEMDERATDGAEPPAVIAAAMMAADVLIAPTTRSLSHTQARKRATDSGVRGATLPGVTAEMLARVMAVDFDPMAARSRAIADLLSEHRTAHVTCPRGTDISLDLEGRTGGADLGKLDVKGAFGNLPCGEGWIAPAGGDGQIVASSIAQLGISNPPAVLAVRDGQLVDAHDGLGPPLLEALTKHGEPGRNLAELGVGTNDRATFTGLILEDEKILGSVHIAFGASAALGGTVSVPIHLDVVVLDASLDIGGVPVLDRGRWVHQPQ